MYIHVCAIQVCPCSVLGSCGGLEPQENGDLLLVYAQVNDSGDYTCRLSNSHGSVDVTATVTVTCENSTHYIFMNMFICTLTLTHTHTHTHTHSHTHTLTDYPTNKTVKSNFTDRMILQCKVDMGENPANDLVMWTMGGVPLTPSALFFPFGSKLFFHVNSEELEGEYTCSVEGQRYNFYVEFLGIDQCIIMIIVESRDE